MKRAFAFIFFVAAAFWFTKNLTSGDSFPFGSLSFRLVNGGTIRKCEQGDGYACWWLGLLKQRSGEHAAEVEYYKLACDKGYGQGCARLGVLAQDEGNLVVARHLAEQACAYGTWEGCFNVACYRSRAGDLDAAFSYLEKALRFGLMKEKNFRRILEDERDFDNLRSDPRFTDITAG
jgi:hypothetical protein